MTTNDFTQTKFKTDFSTIPLGLKKIYNLQPPQYHKPPKTIRFFIVSPKRTIFWSYL